MDFAQRNENKGRDLAVNNLPYMHFTFTTGKYDRVDFFSETEKGKYVGDIKSYTDPQHERRSDKFPDYQIDHNKLFSIKREALNNDRTPLLIVFFSDKMVIWDLNEVDWETRFKWVRCNKKGGNYGEKDWDGQTYLHISEAKVVKDYDKE